MSDGKLESKASEGTIGEIKVPKKKKTKIIIGDAQSAPPFVKEQIIEIKDVGVRGGKKGSTIGARQGPQKKKRLGSIATERAIDHRVSR